MGLLQRSHKYYPLNSNTSTSTINIDMNVPRPFADVAIVLVSMMPEKYDRQVFRIFRRSFYLSPEISSESWDDLNKLIFSYMIRDRGYQDLENDVLEADDLLLLEILSNQKDYRNYWYIDINVSVQRASNGRNFRSKDFFKLVKENRRTRFSRKSKKS